MKKINKAPIDLKKHTALIYAEGVFSGSGRKKFPMRAKTADGLLRYADYPIAGVIDSTARNEGPIFSGLEAGIKATSAKVLILGAAPEGGELPWGWRKDIKTALKSGLHVVSGTHFLLSEDEEFSGLAQKTGAVIWDTRRRPKSNVPIASFGAYHIKKPIILTVGTDAALGKMTASYELQRAAKKRGVSGLLVPTGQTAIMIEGWGVAIDALPADFMAGAVEKMLVDNARDYDAFFVEGQGSMYHPAFANTCISILHGAVPTHLVLVHRPRRKHSVGSSLIKTPGVKEAIELYEKLVLPPYREAKAAGVALNSSGMGEREYTEEKKRIFQQTGLPTGDLIREPTIVEEILDKIL